MEEQAEYKTKNGKEKVLTTDINKMSDKEMGLLAEFIGRNDMDKSQDIIVLERTENFDEAEVIVFFMDELFIRCRKKEKTIFHNEKLAMDSDFKFEWDSAISMRKDDISCISVLRPPLCDCPACSEKREGGQNPEQPQYYLLEVMTPSKDYSIKIYDKESAFMLQYYIREWRFETGEFAVRKKKK